MVRWCGGAVLVEGLIFVVSVISLYDQMGDWDRVR